jgi:hypothetical protein
MMRAALRQFFIEQRLFQREDESRGLGGREALQATRPRHVAKEVADLGFVTLLGLSAVIRGRKCPS